MLPERYRFGDNFQSLDLRLSRSFVFEKRWRVTLIGEVFNAYNAANLSGHRSNLAGAAFGQPGARFSTRASKAKSSSRRWRPGCWARTT